MNVLFGGDEDETMSSRMGKMVRQWKQKPSNKGRYLLSICICKFLNLFEKDHCEKSVEEISVNDDMWSK